MFPHELLSYMIAAQAITANIYDQFTSVNHNSLIPAKSFRTISSCSGRSIECSSRSERLEEFSKNFKALRNFDIFSENSSRTPVVKWISFEQIAADHFPFQQ